MTSKEIGMELNQLRNFLGISFGVVAILLITSMTIGAIILPKEHISHDMNPFSQIKFWVMEEPTTRINNIAYWGVIICFIITISSPFINQRLIKKKENPF